MATTISTFFSRLGSLLLSVFIRKYDILPKVSLTLQDFEADGRILDIGGGGEGVIGRLKGSQVLAIDLHQSELDEAPDGFEKQVMDARAMSFADRSFTAVCAFFSLMYMPNPEDLQKVFKEAWRVMSPGGVFRIWDVDTSCRPKSGRARYLARLRYCVGKVSKTTAYGVRWPEQTRDLDYYTKLAESYGFKLMLTERYSHVLHMQFIKAT